MKKLLALGIASMILTAVGVTCVFANEHDEACVMHSQGTDLLQHMHQYCAEACDHVDENNDGICDHCARFYFNNSQDDVQPAMHAPCVHVDADQDGYCDDCHEYQGSLNGTVQNHGQQNCVDFVDNDGDGFCDHHAQRTTQGQGYGHHHGRHHN